MAMAEMMACESKLSVRATSRGIRKTRPKIRVIHLLPPEIIRTEPSNFRELVQRLTGKSTMEEDEEGTARSRVKQEVEEESRGRIQVGGMKKSGWEMMGRVKEEVVKEEVVLEEGTSMEHYNCEDSTKLLEGMVGDFDGFTRGGFSEFPREFYLDSTSYGDLSPESHVYSRNASGFII